MARRGYDDDEVVREVLRRKAENPDLSERQLIMSLMKDDGLRRIQSKVKAAREAATQAAPPPLPNAETLSPVRTLVVPERHYEEIVLTAILSICALLTLLWYLAGPALTSAGLTIAYGELSLAKALWGLGPTASTVLSKVEHALSHRVPAVGIEELSAWLSAATRELGILVPALFVPPFLATVFLSKGRPARTVPYEGPPQPPPVVALNWLRDPGNAAGAIAVLGATAYMMPIVAAPLLLAAATVALWSRLRDPDPVYRRVRVWTEEVWNPPGTSDTAS